MKIKAEMGKKLGSLWPLEYMVDKVVEIPDALFADFMDQPLERYEFIEQNDVVPYHGDDITHCLLVLDEGRADGVLIQCDGFGAARLMSYLPGARDTVQARLDQAADHIVRQGTEHTASGYWCVYCEELTEKFGLTIPEGSGLDAMLKETLERRSEVAAVEIGNGAIETTFHPEFCKELKGSAEEEKPDIRVRDILPLLDDGYIARFCHRDGGVPVWPDQLRELTPVGREDHAALLDARVEKICLSPEGLTVMLTDVAPEELERFSKDYDSFQRAEQAMGDMTP